MVPFERFDTVSYSHSIVTMAHCDFFIPPALDATVRGACWNIAIPFYLDKLEWCRYPMAKKFDDTFSCFDRISACDGRTDGHLATAQSALCIASRGKNQPCEA